MSGGAAAKPAARGFWKGYLKLSLVTCPVALAPVVSERERVRFHVVNRATGNRVQSRYVDAVSGKPVADEDQVKGYPRGDDDYVMLEDDELDAVALDSTRTIDIESFVPAQSIGWIWYDTPHFLMPDDKVGEEAFAVIREAMRATGKVGIARLVLYRRERAVMLVPRGKGIILWTLRYGDEVRAEDDYVADVEAHAADPRASGMLERLIEARTRRWSPALAADIVEERLSKLIATKAKAAGKTTSAKSDKPDAAKPNNVVDIMDALRKSLGSAPKPAKR
jgi:DNA end-binding protein Ku